MCLRRQQEPGIFVQGWNSRSLETVEEGFRIRLLNHTLSSKQQQQQQWQKYQQQEKEDKEIPVVNIDYR